MRKNFVAFKALSLFIIVMAAAVLTQAQAPRTWVSGLGDDANPCSRTAPCKTFAGAISKTATNGEINCLDPAGYGSVTLNKSVTIDCEDTQGAILASGGVNGIIINITAATDTKKSVKIRGISFNGQATGLNGIRILAANQVVLEEVVIDGFSQHGISLETTTGTTKVLVDSSGIRSNAGNGINTFIIGGNVSLAVTNSRIEMNATGVNLSSATKATIANSVIMGNTTGVAAVNADMGVMGSNISHNTTGFSAGSGGNIRVTGNMITSNTTAFATSGGTITSFTSNMFQGNTNPSSPTSTVLLQ
jgi:hypothetical protein